ncbi:MAG TPA: alpha/beta hydrolase [Roseiarcus sp.]|nr:alpha/beta hydrolase [Roseiarcus sp.]
MLTALFFLLALIAALFAFTAFATARIEARCPAVGEMADAGGGAIHVIERQASGEERGAVLMIHGASGNAADMSVALAHELSRLGFRVLSVDRPGHGWSDRFGCGSPSWPARQAEAIRRAAEALGVREAVVVAHSLGALAGLAMALDQPDFVRALVLIAPVSHAWPGGVAGYYTVGAKPVLGAPLRWLVALPIGLALMGRAVKSVFAPNLPPADFIEATRLPLVLRPPHFRANAEDVATAKAAAIALVPRYPAIRATTEIVTGDMDSVVSAAIHSEGCARDIPGARLTILEGVGHSPHHAATPRVVDAILEAERRARQQAEQAAPEARPSL